MPLFGEQSEFMGTVGLIGAIAFFTFGFWRLVNMGKQQLDKLDDDPEASEGGFSGLLNKLFGK